MPVRRFLLNNEQVTGVELNSFKKIVLRLYRVHYGRDMLPRIKRRFFVIPHSRNKYQKVFIRLYNYAQKYLGVIAVNPYGVGQASRNPPPERGFKTPQDTVFSTGKPSEPGNVRPVTCAFSKQRNCYTDNVSRSLKYQRRGATYKNRPRDGRFEFKERRIKYA